MIKKVLVLCCFLMVLWGCQGNQNKTLKVGVRDDIVNFGYLNEKTKKYYGLEIDIAHELSDRLGYDQVEFQTVQPENRKEKLLNGEIDCLIACYSISESRENNFDFSPSYYKDEAQIMVEKSSLIQDVQQLKNKTVGIVNGTSTGPQLGIKMNELGIIGENVVSNTDDLTVYEGMKAKKFNSYAELSQALEEGHVDAMCADGSIIQTYMDDERQTLNLNIATQEYGVATKKDSPLSQSVSSTIQDMLDDGTISQLIDKWN